MPQTAQQQQQDGQNIQILDLLKNANTACKNTPQKWATEFKMLLK